MSASVRWRTIAALRRLAWMPGPAAEEYRRKALELCARANHQKDPALRVEYENLAFLYMELAERMDGGTTEPAGR